MTVLKTFLGYELYQGQLDALIEDEEGTQLIPKHQQQQFHNQSLAGWMPAYVGTIPNTDISVYRVNGFARESKGFDAPPEDRPVHYLKVRCDQLVRPARILPRSDDS